MSPKILLSCTFMLALAISPAPAARAELPPSVYQELRAKAPEVLEVEITRVAINKRDGENLRDISVFADAKIVSVTRSQSGAQVGDVISLRYMTFEVITAGWVGPSPIMQVETGKTYRVWLKKSGSYFYAAARGRSVEEQ